jgi:hypothetical protein
MLKCPPPGWGLNSLSSFFDVAQDNRFATFVLLNSEYRDLAELDRLFVKFLSGLTFQNNLVDVGLAHHAHGSYRAAAASACAGHLFGVCPLLRLGLEYALYAHETKRNAASRVDFLRRHDTDDHRRASRKTFGADRIIKSVQIQEEGETLSLAKIYELLIDFGAHPNERAFSAGGRLSTVDGAKEYQIDYLSDKIELICFYAILNAYVGCIIIKIIELVLPEAFLKLADSDRNKLLSIRKKRGRQVQEFLAKFDEHNKNSLQAERVDERGS